MSILSITFHTTEHKIADWDIYLESELHQMVENLLDVDKYILSDVHSEMLNEGKNTNLFLWFDNDELRSQFMESELVNLEERIAKKFGNEVMVFPTFLNPKQKRFQEVLIPIYYIPNNYIKFAPNFRRNTLIKSTQYGVQTNNL